MLAHVHSADIFLHVSQCTVDGLHAWPLMLPEHQFCCHINRNSTLHWAGWQESLKHFGLNGFEEELHKNWFAAFFAQLCHLQYSSLPFTSPNFNNLQNNLTLLSLLSSLIEADSAHKFNHGSQLLHVFIWSCYFMKNSCILNSSLTVSLVQWYSSTASIWIIKRNVFFPLLLSQDQSKTDDPDMWLTLSRIFLF